MPTLTPSRLFLASGLLTLAIVAVLTVPTMLASQFSGRIATVVSGPNPGNLAPGTSLEDATTGGVTGLSVFRGNPVWIEFWATWCPGCKEETPLIEKMYRKYSAAGLQVVAVNVQESRSTVLSYISQNKLDWVFLLDTAGRTADLYYVNGLPYHVFVDAQGTIRDVHPGVLDEQGMEYYISHIMPAQ